MAAANDENMAGSRRVGPQLLSIRLFWSIQTLNVNVFEEIVIN